MTLQWFDAFEERVRQTVAKLHRLKRENKRLKDKIRKLEKEAKSAPKAADDGEWQRQRTELKERVERLTSQLESLLDG